MSAKGEVLNAWSTPGPSAFDFRSDTITTPNASMLQAIQNTTLFDDAYGEDPTTTALEANMAELLGHQAGLFLLSGTMGNQVAMRSLLTQPPHAVLCDHRAHISYLEAGGIAMLCGAMVNGVVPSNGKYLRVQDIEENIILGNAVYSCPTKVISLENTLRGIINPLEEVKKISEFAKKNGIKMHLDGARLWEVAAASAGSLADYGKCFDSVTLCFSKGLGAPMGSILVGSKGFIERAKWIRQAIGGALRQAGVITAAAQNAVDVNFAGQGEKLKRTHVIAKRIAKHWESLGGVFENPVDTNMVCLDLVQAGVDVATLKEMAKEKGVKLTRGRIVVHYQIVDEAVERLEAVLTSLMKR
ncbi:aromatic amino acid beta-eliminating lyase/threonine aldolase [Mollisia scopiformis]|uniref:Aromatic amino acid beta-eliminating lyase/threonine aldolase n=1 Tax=Mollisia scopiformis TaxID=149040 RepID=A0A194X1K6_MOLSC|nr:aromatic amino acid beta-eliminating lyase/threonine aldolase [Mollisia scopiformis]KUJ13864.1 aromatic amino acid beta-eliminating lyase/threonine aldolase [Mollisia scopiformis]